MLIFAVAFTSTLAVFIACEEKKDDVCQRFDAIQQINPTCDIPSVCCPQEEGGNCYYVSSSGKKYYCNSSLATTNDPDGCNQAQSQYIAENCQAAKMSAGDVEKLKLEMTKFTRELLEKARHYSVFCN